MSARSSSDRPDRIVAAIWPFDVRPGAVALDLERALEGLERAAAAGAELLVLPEKWTTSYLPRYDAEQRAASERAVAALHGRAEELGVVAVGSAIAGEGEGERPFNELHVVGRGGDRRPYRKRMLFSPADEAAGCAAGSAPPETLDTAVGRLAGIVCYDLRFPEVSRPAFYAGAEILAVPAEWPSARAETFELLACARAAESQCWVVLCNRAASIPMHGSEVAFPGTALLVDPLGRVAARMDGGELLVGEIDLALVREVRAAIPCLRDLRAAGLAGP
jgi:predicted amidohydrolase